MILQGLVEKAGAAACPGPQVLLRPWNRGPGFKFGTAACCILAQVSQRILVVVDPDALPLESHPFEPDKTTSDAPCALRWRMYSMSLESEDMEEMEE